MESLFKVDGENVQLTLQRIIEESISQRVTGWKIKQKKIPDRELAAQIVAMCWGHDSLPSAGPGCLMPDTKGGYVYVPYDESRDGLPPPLEERIDKLERWFRNPANGPTVREMDKLLEKEVNEKCFWEFPDGDNASRLDFHGKLYNMDWNCTESEVIDSLEAYSNPLFNRDAVRDRLLKDLETIYHPRDAVEEAELYVLCNERDVATPTEECKWKPLRRRPNDIKLMKRESREESKWVAIIRPSLLRHYKLCNRVFNLQRRQMKFCQEIEPSLLQKPQETERQYFNGG
ncbi:uncharacterized protein P884DRAFT_274094 [Thermothelomyces heterothallicus CBS 202.75]|uniref:uncharacterized protein n=1 Tax=Thermothelomyces heterothallicus CBS 202.75 TaxID=1149848 RepID=UPI0037447726